MRTKLFFIVFGLGATLLAQGVMADCNRPSTDYERQDCAFKADRDFRRGNSEVDQAADEYLENLQRNADEEQRRQADAQRSAAEEQQRMLEIQARERRLQQINQDIDAMIQRAQASGKANETGECIRIADQAYGLSGHSHSRMAQALSAAGLCHVLQGDFVQGESKLIKAIQLVEATEGRNSPWTQKVVRQLASVYKITNRPGDAQSLLGKYGLSQ